MRVPPHLPKGFGLGALDELHNVDWGVLHAAFGQGVTGNDLAEDVERSLAMLRVDTSVALRDGLWSNICHQGTVYEATAYALPFVAAVAAGDVTAELRNELTDLLGEIAVSGSCEAPTGSSSGSYGDQVSSLIRQTLTRCDPYLSAIARADPKQAPLIAAVRRLNADPSEQNRDALIGIIDPDL